VKHFFHPSLVFIRWHRLSEWRPSQLNIPVPP